MKKPIRPNVPAKKTVRLDHYANVQSLIDSFPKGTSPVDLKVVRDTWGYVAVENSIDLVTNKKYQEQLKQYDQDMAAWQLKQLTKKQAKLDKAIKELENKKA